MAVDSKQLLKAVIKRIHPDLFGDKPQQRDANTKALAVLNSYLTDISEGQVWQEIHIEFWLLEGNCRSRVRAILPSHGSLGPLFYKCNLISKDQLTAGFGDQVIGPNNTSLLSWLGSSIQEANKAAEVHASLKREIRHLRLKLEDCYQLRSLQLEGEYSMSIAEQSQHKQALLALAEVLHTSRQDHLAGLQGLTMKLYHPKAERLFGLKTLNPELYAQLAKPEKGFVGDDGVVHIIADTGVMHKTLAGMDLSRAQLLSDVSTFWLTRSRDLAAALTDLLGVKSISCDTRTELSNQAFATWAGQILRRREEFTAILEGRKFLFTLLAHNDQTAPQLEFSSSSPVLQVCMNTDPEQLIQFLMGSIAQEASSSASGASAAKAEEESLLEEVRGALGLRQVICICSSLDHAKAVAAARRLLLHARQIRASNVHLAGATLAIDDRYEVWDSGYISIPFDFQLQDLQPKMQRLLAGSSSQSSAVNSHILDNEVAAASARSNGQVLEKDSIARPAVASSRVAAQKQRGAGVSSSQLVPVHIPLRCKSSYRGLQSRNLGFLYCRKTFSLARACSFEPPPARLPPLKGHTSPNIKFRALYPKSRHSFFG